jgi:Tfp pilus assembly protein PilF
MNKLSTLAVFSFLLLSVLFSGCASQLQHNQMKFGIQSAQKDLWDEAIFRWEKSIRSGSDSAAAHNNLGVAYEKKGMIEEAEKEYKIALKLDPDNKHIQSNYTKFKKYWKDSEKTEEEKDEKK